MTKPEIPERIRGGTAGTLAGRFKRAAGALLGNEDLAREGRLQQARVEAEADSAVAADAQRRAQESTTEAAERAAEQERVAAAREAAQLRQEARRAEAAADATDPRSDG